MVQILDLWPVSTYASNPTSLGVLKKEPLFYRSRDMATTCPGPGKCGTVAPVWLDLSSAVNLTANTFSVDACVSWGFGDGGFDNFDCCLFTLPVKVKNCQGFRVYYLGPTQACDIAYCSAPTGQSMPGAGGTLEQGKQTSIFRVIFFLRLSLSPGVMPERSTKMDLLTVDMSQPSIKLQFEQDYYLKCSHSCRSCRYNNYIQNSILIIQFNVCIST